MAFSIVIPSRNLTNLKACVGAIRACGETARVIVVDDGLAFGDIDPAFPRVYPSFDLQSGRKPFCFARNVNIGIRAAGTDDVVILNDDALLTTGHGFTRIANVAQDNPKVGIWSAAVMGKVVNPSHVHVPGLARTDLWRTTNRMVPFVAVYIARDVLDRIGPLDDRFCGIVDGPEMLVGSESIEVEKLAVYGGEDDDYCYRVRAAGLKIATYNGCVVEHGTLQSTFRPDGKGRSTAGARLRFEQIHGFPMGSR